MFAGDHPLTVDRIVPGGGEIEGSCPVCDTLLTKGEIENRPILYCGRCYGFLVRNEDFGHVVRLRRSRRQGCESEAARPIDTDQYQRTIRCPNCTKRMEVHPYYGPGNVVIDSCSACQYIWLDHGELRRVERAEGGREPDVLPLHVNEYGEVTIIPPAEPYSRADVVPSSTPDNSVTLADILFELW